MNNHNVGHRQRVRERFTKDGLDGFAEHEVIEVLLFMAIPYRDTNKVAHDLMDKFGSIAGVLDASIEELVKVKGISYTTATNIKIIRGSWERYKVSKSSELPLKSLKDYVAHAKGVLDHSDKEKMLVYYIYGDNRCMGHQMYTSDKVGSIYINNKDIVTQCMVNNASGVVVFHNHPASRCMPSVADIKYTEGLYGTLRGIDVSLIDHIVVGIEGVYSMSAHGILDKIREKYNK